MVVSTISIPKAIDPDYIRSDFLPKLKPIPKPEDDIDIPGLKYLYMGPKGPSEENASYKMPDGVVIYEDKRYSQQEVEHAYLEAKLKSESDHRGNIIKVVSDAAIRYLLIIAILYFFGWMLGWIYRGFKK